MTGHGSFFPAAIALHDLRTMREAVRRSAKLTGAVHRAELDVLAKIVFRYYARGLADPRRLADIAAFLSSSRAFHNELAYSQTSGGAIDGARQQVGSPSAP
ncbi:hypothetical protein EPK99_06710 [Neorhizobium lilium]|uniref:Uncharacterized protein n=1 Tax=Neorhizobium lilium TaxID=2503024 RepID=A0A444LHB9_9HYPH|nr:hypothetical protein [Neorhizobium lilium]RWX78314.1 hypothetical protein EPK99_06710 [Neorhizobium lilium]